MRNRHDIVLRSLLVGVVAVIVVVFARMYAHAVDQSLWIDTGPLTKTLVTGNAEDDSDYGLTCTKQDRYQLKYRHNGSRWVEDGRSDVNGGCWYDTSFGSYGVVAGQPYARFGDVGAVARLDFFNPIIPISGGFATKHSNGTSFFSGLYLYEKPEEQLVLHSPTQSGGEYARYSFSGSGPIPWSLQHPTSNGVASVGSVGVSANGDWMAIETSSSFIRLNVQTKEVLAFEQPLYEYGIGQNPGYGLTISNDGRYVALHGGTVSSRVFWLYDLATCVPDTTANAFVPAAGCGKRNLRQELFADAPATVGPMNTRFNSGGDTLVYDLRENDQLKRYAVTAGVGDDRRLDYLALGDSFTSGEGDTQGGTYYLPGTDGDGETVFNTGLIGYPYDLEKCHLSTRSYPYIIGGESRFRSVACSGSATLDIVNTTDNYYGIKNQLDPRFYPREDARLVKQNAILDHALGREAQLKFVEAYKPRAVTVGIGGNDMRFADKLMECLTNVDETCRYATLDRYSTAHEIRDVVYPNLLETYQKLRDASPTTTFYAVGYPQLVSAANQCGLNVLLDDLEREYARETVRYLNAIVQTAAANTGFTYLDIEDSLDSTGLCSGASRLAVNGLTLGDDTFRIIGNESYHPNELGHSLMAAAISAQTEGDIVRHQPCAVGQGIACPVVTPVPQWPAYFQQATPPNYTALAYLKMIATEAGESAVETVKVGTEVALKSAFGVARLMAHSPVTVQLRSTPTDLGVLTVGADGQLAATVTVPHDVEPGYHTLHILGTTPGGDAVDYYEPVFVYVDENDVDNDGVANTEDLCPFATPAGVDQDRDGIDDACDGLVDQLPVDTVAPTVTYTLDQLPNETGWLSRDTLIRWQAADDVSTDVVQPPTTLADLEGEHTYTSDSVCDEAANCAVGSVVLKIDKTSPQVEGVSWARQPKAVTETSSVTLTAIDAESGVVAAEYFIGDQDPGVGNGATMRVYDGGAAVDFGTDFATGVYKLSFRVKDRADNWSQVVSDYLVVYDPQTSVRTSGAGLIKPNLETDNLPGLVSAGQDDILLYGLSVGYRNGSIVKTSDVVVRYQTGRYCHIPQRANNCHRLELNATTIRWVALSDLSKRADIEGEATLTVDGATRPVLFRLTAIDNGWSGFRSSDRLTLRIYESADDIARGHATYHMIDAIPQFGVILIR